MKVSGGRWSHKLTTSSGILGGAGVVGNPDTTCHDWAIGSIGGGAACERLVMIGLAGGGTGRGIPLWWERSGSGSLWPFPAGLVEGSCSVSV